MTEEERGGSTKNSLERVCVCVCVAKSATHVEMQRPYRADEAYRTAA